MNPEFFASLCSDVERRARIKGLQGVKALKDIYERYVAPENRPTSTKSSSYLTRLWVASDALLIGACSHDSLFPHVAAVVHHGGAGKVTIFVDITLLGTTAAGIRAARPTLICPFFGDQPFWGEMVFRAKVGPEPCPIQQVIYFREFIIRVFRLV